MRQMWVLVFGRRRCGGTLVPFALVVQYCGANVGTGFFENKEVRSVYVACGMKKETSIASMAQRTECSTPTFHAQRRRMVDAGAWRHGTASVHAGELFRVGQAGKHG